MKYGRSSEQLEHAQLELIGGMVAAPVHEPASNDTLIEPGRTKRAAKPRPSLRELPEHLPRRTVVHAPPSGSDGRCDCQACGRALREIGQDVCEVLDYEPGSFHVVRHVRSRLGVVVLFVQIGALLEVDESRPCKLRAPKTPGDMPGSSRVVVSLARRQLRASSAPRIAALF